MKMSGAVTTRFADEAGARPDVLVADFGLRKTTHVSLEFPHYSIDDRSRKSTSSSAPRVSLDEEGPRVSGSDFEPPRMPLSKPPQGVRFKTLVTKNMDKILSQSPTAENKPTQPLSSFVKSAYSSIISQARTELEFDRHMVERNSHLLNRDLPSPFHEVYRANTLTLAIKRLDVPESVLKKDEKPAYFAESEGNVFIDSFHLAAKVRQYKTPWADARPLPLNEDLELQTVIQVPVSYHSILFDHLLLEIRSGNKLLAKAPVPLAALAIDEDGGTSGSRIIKLRSYENGEKVRQSRKGQLGKTQIKLLPFFGAVHISWAFSFDDGVAWEIRRSKLGTKGFWHSSEVEKWLLGEIALPADAVRSRSPARSERVSRSDSRWRTLAKDSSTSSAATLLEESEEPFSQPTMLLSPTSTPDILFQTSPSGTPDDGIVFGTIRKIVRTATYPAKSAIRVTTMMADQVTSALDAVSTLPRARDPSPAPGTQPPSPTPSQSSASRKERAKALAELQPALKGFQAGINIDLRRLLDIGFLMKTSKRVKVVNQVFVDVPEPPMMPPKERKKVNMARVGEARWWLKFSRTTYVESAVAPFLSKSGARSYNVDRWEEELGLKDLEILSYEDTKADAFTSKFGVFWKPKISDSMFPGPKESALVIAIRGTAGVKEALADLTGEYLPFRKGISHKGFVFAANYIYQQQKTKGDFRRWVTQYKPERIVFTGHSYGGAVATLLSILFKDHLEEFRELTGNPHTTVEAIVFGPAPAVSEHLQNECDHVESYVNYLDPVPSLCYGTMIDYRELLIEADRCLLEGNLTEQQVLDKVEELRKQLAAESKLKLQVAGKLFFIRPIPKEIKELREIKEEPCDRPWAPKAKGGFFAELCAPDSEEEEAPPPASVTAAFAGMKPSEDYFVVEPRSPRELFELRLHRKSKVKPSAKTHSCNFYGTSLKSAWESRNGQKYGV